MSPRKRTVVTALALTVVYAAGMMTAPSAPASAAEAHTNPPWVYTMDASGTPGLLIQGGNGPNTQALEVTDYNGAPIFAVNLAGGAAVLGDSCSVFAGGDVFNPAIQLRPDGGIQLGKSVAGCAAAGTCAPVMYSSHGVPGVCYVRPAWFFSDNGAIYACATGGTGAPVRVTGTGPQR